MYIYIFFIFHVLYNSVSMSLSASPCLFFFVFKGIPTAKSTRPRRRRAFRCPKCENQTFYQPRELTHPTLGEGIKTSSKNKLGRGYVSIPRVYQKCFKIWECFLECLRQFPWFIQHFLPENLKSYLSDIVEVPDMETPKIEDHYDRFV